MKVTLSWLSFSLVEQKHKARTSIKGWKALDLKDSNTFLRKLNSGSVRVLEPNVSLCRIKNVI